MVADGPIDNEPIALRGQQRVFTTQLLLCLWIGLSTFLLFCILRYRWPHIYAVRTLRKGSGAIKMLPSSIFGWVKQIYLISDEEVLSYSGLDAFVFLTYFKMGTKIFSILSVLAVVVLSPVRYYNTGNYDKEANVSWYSPQRIIDLVGVNHESSAPPDMSRNFPAYLWVYPIFTYIFSFVVYTQMYHYTRKVLKTRQKYLASQNSIVDRTIRLDAIPKKLIHKNDPLILKRFIEDLGIGKVVDVKLIYDWTPLENLFNQRKNLLQKIEGKYASAYGMNIDVYDVHKTSSVSLKSPSRLQEDPAKFRKFKSEVDELMAKLSSVDSSIREIQESYDPTLSTIDNSQFSQVSSAFVTMDSVASAQMAAQAVLDPRVYKLIVDLAPAPKDVEWKNFKLSPLKKILKSYLITAIIILSYVLLFFPVSSLATLLNIKTITKFWPALGKFIGKSKWLTTFVTGILPPLLFSLMNILLPYFYKYLSKHQGYNSNSDVELSTLLKNFFYIFFNLFLVFTVTGTFSNYWSFLSDTTKIAYHLATSLKRLSLFYVDLILLQGLAMFPVRLLQIGDVVILNVIGKMFLLKEMLLKTPRDYRFYYYTPPVFDFGLQLPQHILIFIIILIYSVVSSKIVVSGLVYFILGFFVYKYQLIYTCVHPPHSTGKVWIMIFRRLILGLVLFQLFMIGTLALEQAFILAILCTPLVFMTFVFSWNFEKFYVPLNSFIALRAIQSPDDYDREFDDDDDDNDDPLENSSLTGPGSRATSANLDPEDISLASLPRYSSTQTSLRRKRSTLDEEREQFSDYTYPRLVDPLYGPWVGFEGEYVSMLEFDRQSSLDELESGDFTAITSGNGVIVRKKLRVAEWE